MNKFKSILAGLALALSLPSAAQWGGVYNLRATSDPAVVASLITAPCTTSTAILYNAATPCSANLSFNPTGSLLTMGGDVVVSRYAAKQLMISGDGVGATTNAGWVLGYGGTSGWSAIYPSTAIPGSNTYSLLYDGSQQIYNYPNGSGSTGSHMFSFANQGARFTIGGTAGLGPSITAGTATTDVNALSLTQTWNNAAVTFTGIKSNVTDTASNAASLLMDLRVGGSSKFKVDKLGGVSITDATDSSSTTTGSLKTAGGLGVAKSLYAGGPTYITYTGPADESIFRLTNTSATSTHRAALQVKTGASANVWQFFARDGDAFIGNAGTFDVARISGTTGQFLLYTDFALSKTITAPGTTGAQTINKSTGRVNFAAAATSLVVTNSLVDANSICQVTIATNDANAANGKCVTGAGSFTIYLGVAGTGETAVNFTITN